MLRYSTNLPRCLKGTVWRLAIGLRIPARSSGGYRSPRSIVVGALRATSAAIQSRWLRTAPRIQRRLRDSPSLARMWEGLPRRRRLERGRSTALARRAMDTPTGRSRPPTPAIGGQRGGQRPGGKRDRRAEMINAVGSWAGNTPLCPDKPPGIVFSDHTRLSRRRGLNAGVCSATPPT